MSFRVKTTYKSLTKSQSKNLQKPTEVDSNVSSISSLLYGSTEKKSNNKKGTTSGLSIKVTTSSEDYY
jgi:hypothetical protein